MGVLSWLIEETKRGIYLKERKLRSIVPSTSSHFRELSLLFPLTNKHKHTNNKQTLNLPV